MDIDPDIPLSVALLVMVVKQLFDIVKARLEPKKEPAKPPSPPPCKDAIPKLLEHMKACTDCKASVQKLDQQHSVTDGRGRLMWYSLTKDDLDGAKKDIIKSYERNYASMITRMDGLAARLTTIESKID